MFLYHLKPQNIVGNMLCPLSKLKSISREEYNKHIKKYEYRIKLTKLKINVADCYWNDVIHFSPVDINKLLVARKKAFDEIHATYNFPTRKKYFRININSFAKDKIFIYTNDKDSISDYDQNSYTDQFVKYDESFDKILINEIPSRQIDYFKKAARDNTLKPYLFTKLPHVLYKGEIEFSKFEELEVKETL